MAAKENKDITSPWLIVGEGRSDAVFLEELCADRQISDFQFMDAGGLPNIGSFLEGLEGLSHIALLKSLMLVIDADEDPTGNFVLVQKQLEKFKQPRPDMLLQKATRDNRHYSVSVLMLPYPTPEPNEGCLESMLLPIVEGRFTNEADCVQKYCTCTKIAEWGKRSARDKMRLRCLLSALSPDNPSGGLPQFLLRTSGLIAFDHASLKPLEQLLRNFKQWAMSNNNKWEDWKIAQAA